MKNYVYNDFSVKQALTLDIAGVSYEVTQYSAGWAVNEIPVAACMLAIGRNARTQIPAAVHANAHHRQMVKAVVWFKPKEEYDRKHDWPGTREIIFEGYFTGFAYRKVNGKVQVIASLIHWLAALGMSSCLTKGGAVSNPTALNAAAVLRSLVSTENQGIYLSHLVPVDSVLNNVRTDLWSGIKTLFCALASKETMPCGGVNACAGNGKYEVNDFALNALRRIEGPAKNCPLAYKWGVPLPLDTLGTRLIDDAIATSIGEATIASYSSFSFWDKLVGDFCPKFGMAVVPMIDTAILIADTPAMQGVAWREIKTDDYDAFDMTSELHRPIRAVGVLSHYESKTLKHQTARIVEFVPTGGCYIETSEQEGDGITLFIQPPSWLSVLRFQPNFAGDTTNIDKEGPSRTATNTTNPPVTPESPAKDSDQAAEMYRRYAHYYYTNQMLRGRGGSISGKLRFDIAPGSIVKILNSTEQFIGPGQDDLGITLYACVQRVNMTINAEAGLAGTSFSFTHVRSEQENTETRTSVAKHPLFGSAIHGKGKHGCPLKDVFEFPEPG